MEKEFGRIFKNDTAEIVVRMDDFGGKRGLTIREFVSSDKYTGFTKQGVRIPSADFLKFREMINSVSISEMNDTPDASTVDTKKYSKTSGQRTLKEKPKQRNDDEAEEIVEDKGDLPDY